MARQHVSVADVTDCVIAEVESGDATSEIIAAPTDGKAIRVLGYVLTVSASTTLQWKSGSTAKSGVMSLSTGISSPGHVDSRSFQCAANQALNLTSTGAVTVGGHLTYQLVEPV
jgi:hypothetical protein